MQESELILTLTGSLAAALVLGFITQRLGLSPIVGYLLAGLIVGPYTPGFVADRALANEFAEIGVILLMFGVGLHFHPKDLLAVRNVAITGALCQSAAATVLGTLAARTFGWSWGASLVFGLALSVASTVMLTRVLVDNQDLQTPTGRIAIGWLVVEDIFAVIVLVLLPAIFSAPSGEAVSVAEVVALTVAKLALLGVFAFVVGGRLIPRILNGVAATHSRELFTLTVLVLALGIAVGSALTFGVSMALGAFLAGMIVGQSEFSFRAASDALPMRDAFAVLFFVSVGMLLDPGTLMNSPRLLLATLAIVLLGKPIAALLIVTLLGYGSKIAIGVAVALAQIGEFSLILATVGDQLNILPGGATNLIVAASIVSLTLNPMLYRSMGWLNAALARSPGVWRILNPKPNALDITADVPKAAAAYRAVVVGYGPIGQTVARLLRDGGIEPVIVEINLETTRRVRDEGHRVVYGDAAHTEVLEVAGIRNAVALVVSGPTSAQSAEIIRLARNMNPDIRVLARSYYLRETAIMRDAGANEVFSGEGEVALAMTEYILGVLGATPEQMDRERERVREEVFRISRTNSQH
ncbi:MAG: cation:proton antiporter [Acidobacteria bacterium]|nr:cation:proton antiporter [Acidobacteriota bacterium]